MRLLSFENWSRLASTLVSVLWLLILLQPSECDSNGIANTTIAADEQRLLCPPAPPITASFSLSESNITDIYFASKLSLLVYPDISGRIEFQIEEQRKNYQRFDGWGDFNDQALVAKTGDNSCHVSFAATSFWSPLDQWQNLNPLPKKLGDNCWVRRGYYNAYNSSYYKDELRASLDACINSCGEDNPCRLILSGLSQGGAAAITAAVDLKHYNPLVITFGAPHTFLLFLGDCAGDFDASRHYQFVGVWEGYYDFVSQQINPFFASHLGTVLLIDDDDNMIGHPRETTVEQRCRYPQSYIPHVLYPFRIANIYQRGCFPIVVGGWVSGHDCSYDDECNSGLCGSGICQQSLGYR